MVLYNIYACFYLDFALTQYAGKHRFYHGIGQRNTDVMLAYLKLYVR